MVSLPILIVLMMANCHTAMQPLLPPSNLLSRFKGNQFSAWQMTRHFDMPIVPRKPILTTPGNQLAPRRDPVDR